MALVGAGWRNLYLARSLAGSAEGLCSEFVEQVVNRVTLVQVVVEMDCEGLERVGRVVGARLRSLRVVETHSVLSEVEVTGVEVVKRLT